MLEGKWAQVCADLRNGARRAFYKSRVPYLRGHYMARATSNSQDVFLGSEHLLRCLESGEGLR